MSAQPEEHPKPEETPDEDVLDVESEETPDEPGEQQPADVDPDAAGKVIDLHATRGALTLRPGQVELTNEQRAALVAIGIDTVRDPLVIPHVRPFMHMCQVRGLDPWAREAYLIGRGTGDYRKFTMQTGIDGYRKMAGATGRFIRVKSTVWTGQDDDDRSYRAVDDGEGGVVMRRVWYDQWPASRGYPGAAKVTIEHYDEQDNVVTTSAVADWSMYAPFSPKYDGYGRNKTKVRDADGNDVMVLNDMWAKGYAHMLAKCAEALAHRKAFPNTMNGIYVNEEMHRADAEAEAAQRNAKREARQAAYLAAQNREAIATRPAAETDPEREPVVVGEVAQEVLANAGAAPAPDQAPVGTDTPPEAPQSAGTDRSALLRAELDFQADTLGHSARMLAKRPMQALRKDLDAFTEAELLPLVAGLRVAVIARLRASDRGDLADTYGRLGPEDVAGGEITGQDPAPEDDPRMDADPTKPHQFVDDQGLCALCGEEDQNKIHPGE